MSKYHEVFKGGPFFEVCQPGKHRVQYHLFRQLWLFLGVKLMEIHRNLFSRKLICFCGNGPVDPQRQKYPKLPRLEDNLSKDDDYTFLQG